MEDSHTNTLLYRRSHFVTRLPLNRLYTPSHYWSFEQNGAWRTGLTRFATWTLGEIVDYGFDVLSGTTVRAGQVLGWIEGFKAVSDLLCIIDGKLLGSNPQLSRDPEAIDRDCYREGWIYEASGKPDALFLDVHGYKALLDTTIDKLVEKQPRSE